MGSPTTYDIGAELCRKDTPHRTPSCGGLSTEERRNAWQDSRLRIFEYCYQKISRRHTLKRETGKVPVRV